MPGLAGRLPTFPKVYNVYFLAIVSTVGGMLFGFDISSMSAIVGTDQYLEYFDNPAGAYQGAIGSALAAGSIIGCLIAGPISDKIGRRDACMFGELEMVPGILGDTELTMLRSMSMVACWHRSTGCNGR